MEAFRKLKIHPKHRFRTWDKIIVPEIRLIGRWLERCGFKAGQDILIKQEKNRLIITVIQEDPISQQNW